MNRATGHTRPGNLHIALRMEVVSYDFLTTQNEQSK